MCEGKIFIPLILQSYILNWHHKYLLHPGMDIMWAVIRQNLHWTKVKESINKDVSNGDT